ncbi:hypothetical protein GCM10023311_02680 [Flaviramulus aquimarinus]|uniref:Polysaccharide pyruvyl transferase domain-containing protein n=1 Tax=Flaviramulus aquimarinus TaxID=1170456 RepID=A0ABP9EQQ8_9FLAO
MIKVAHFGTFDVDNYGDLLFPHIAEYRLPKYQWEHISPTNNPTVFKDAKPIVSFEKARNNVFDAIAIGGGNIIHLLDNHNTVYNNITGFSYANLWVGAAKMAIEQKIPYIFNAPGISKNFNRYIKKRIASATFKNSNYVAFRDRFSKEIACRTFKNKTIFESKLTVVPDTAFEINKLWPLEKTKVSDYITVNLNERYHINIEETALGLDQISSKLKMPIKLIVIGDCHGDKAFTIKVSKKMKSEHTIVNSDELKKVAQVIGHGKHFFGSSMHAFITALSYGIPALLVLNKKPLNKFIGLLEIAALESNVICKSFDEALKRTNSPAILSKKARQKIQSDLNTHWNKIDDIIKQRKSSTFSLYIIIFEKLLNLNLKFYRMLSKFR